jgi:hypothetical protein
VRRLGIGESVYLDADFAASQALGASVWPTFVLIDRTGQVRYRLSGALGARAQRKLEEEIEVLLRETR